jgi:hypothetical protein
MNVNAAADTNDLRVIKTCLTSEYFLLNPSSAVIFKLVLKRSTAPIFQGGLTSRLSLLSDILPRVVYA